MNIQGFGLAGFYGISIIVGNLMPFYTYKDRLIGLVVRVFANSPGSIPGRDIPKTLKMVLDTSLLSTQHYKVRIKGKVEQSWERSSALNLHLGVVAIEKGAFRSPSTTVANFTFTLYIYIKYMISEHILLLIFLNEPELIIFAHC